MSTIDSSLCICTCGTATMGIALLDLRDGSFKLGNLMEFLGRCLEYSLQEIYEDWEYNDWCNLGWKLCTPWLSSSSSSSWSIRTGWSDNIFSKRGNFNRPLFRSDEFCSRGPKGPRVQHILKEPVYFQSNTIVRIPHSSGAHSSGISFEKRNFNSRMRARRSREIIHD